MARRHFFCLLTLSVLLLVFASASGDELRGDRAAASAGWEQIDAGALVIDVRSEGEYANGHLPDATGGDVKIETEETEGDTKQQKNIKQLL